MSNSNVRISLFFGLLMLSDLGLTQVGSLDEFGQSVNAIKAESEAIYLPDSEPPDPEDTKYLTINEMEGDILDMNNQEIKRKRIVISGVHVVYEKNNKNELYMLNGREDIESIDIVADTFEIRDGLSLPGANIGIYAREVIANNGAYIKTTPSERRKSENLWNGGPGKNGLKGYPGGAISLYSETMDGDILLDATGGIGGQGGPGSPGIPGGSISPVSVWDDGKGIVPEDMKKGVIYQECKEQNCFWYGCNSDKNWSTGSKTKPGDGSDGQSPGKPGEGGDGGSINIAKEIFEKISTIVDAGNNAESQPSQIGGMGGTPSPWYFIRTTSTERNVKGKVEDEEKENEIINSGLTKKGNDAASPVQENFGINGYVNNMESGRYASLRPILLRTMLEYAKDTYINSRNTVAVKKMLESYMADIEALMLTELWGEGQWSGALGKIDDTVRAEIQESYAEMQQMVTQIDSGNDYYGNPPGWTPLLSYEAWKGVYEKEVESALQTTYLGLWFNKVSNSLVAKKEAIKKIREQLINENEVTLDDIKIQQDVLNLEIGPAIAELESHIPFYMNYLQGLEENIRKKAESEEKDKAKKAQMIGNVRILATVLKAVPIPLSVGIGAGLDVLSGIAEGHDDKDPWTTIKQLPSVSEAFNEGYNSPEVGKKRNELEAALNQANHASRNIDFGDITSVVENGNKISGSINTISNMLGAVTSIREINKPIKVSQEKVSALASNLMSQDPLYQDMNTKIQNLISQKGALYDRASQAAKMLNESQIKVARNTLAISNLNTEIMDWAQTIRPETQAFVNEMVGESKRRLHKYKYMMAKAYQYRLVETFPDNVNQESVVDSIVGFVEKNQQPKLETSQVLSLKSIYDQELNAIGESILNKIQEGTERRIVGETIYDLSEQQIEELSKSGETRLNLFKPNALSGGFFLFDQDVRIQEIKLDMTSDSSSAFVLSLEHPGESLIEKNGKIYKFTHNSVSSSVNSKAHFWQATYTPRHGVTQNERSGEEDSLLYSILDKPTNDKVMLFSLPGAWADMSLRTYSNSTNLDPKIKNVRIHVKYTTFRSVGKYQKLNIYSKSPEEAELQTLASLTKEDVNLRKDGYNLFNRFYAKGTTVRVSAPENYGKYRFTAWRQADGTVYSFDRTVDVNLKTSMSLISDYEVDETYDWDGDGMPDVWEQTYSLNKLDPSDALLDTDSDGFTNLDEYRRGTNPIYAGLEHQLTVLVNQGGKVISDPLGINCGKSCIRKFPKGSGLWLDAKPEVGYVFAGWSGGCLGVYAPIPMKCWLELNDETTVTARFYPPIDVSQKLAGNLYAGVGSSAYINVPYTNQSQINQTHYIVASNRNIQIQYPNYFTDNAPEFHELVAGIKVQGYSYDYIATSYYAMVKLTHKKTGQIIEFQVTRPSGGKNNSGVTVEFLDGAIAFTSHLTPPLPGIKNGRWTMWITKGGMGTEYWGTVPAIQVLPEPITIDLSRVRETGALNPAVNSANIIQWDSP